MVVAAQCDLRHATRLFLAEHAARGDLRAAEILKVLAGEGAEMALDGPYGRCRVAIAVCTAKRPGMLRHCLESIASQIVSAQVEVEAVVVDNEGEPNNQTLVLAAAARCRFPVHYVHEPRQGIPQARNAALENCRELTRHDEVDDDRKDDPQCDSDELAVEAGSLDGLGVLAGRVRGAGFDRRC